MKTKISAQDFSVMIAGLIPLMLVHPSERKYPAGIHDYDIAVGAVNSTDFPVSLKTPLGVFELTHHRQGIIERITIRIQDDRGNWVSTVLFSSLDYYMGPTSTDESKRRLTKWVTRHLEMYFEQIGVEVLPA